MQVKQGTRLTVESKEGDWYRVLTPTGSRAYVRRDVVQSSEKKSKTLAKNSLPPRNNKNFVPFGALGDADMTPDEVVQAFERLKAELGTTTR